jgi:thiamine kinase-like enzyme
MELDLKKVLIYCPNENSPIFRALEKVVGAVIRNAEVKPDLSGLVSGKYDRIIDARQGVSEEDRQQLFNEIEALGLSRTPSIKAIRGQISLAEIIKLAASEGKQPSRTGSLLEPLFAGKLDEQTLEGLVSDVDAELERVTVNTGSIGVVSFTADGKKAYGKVSASRPALLNEERALNELQSDRIARVLSPKPIGLVLGKDAGALFTWGTENRDVHSQEDIDQYSSLFNTLLFQYAQDRKLDLTKLANDPAIRDVFNRAIVHTALRDYVSLNSGQVVYDVEVLEGRARNSQELLRALQRFTRTYLDASVKAASLNSGRTVFIHGDARPENIGSSPLGIRPLVDWSNARMGSFAEDLSALEVDDAGKYLDWYKFVSSLRGLDFVDEDSRELLICHEVLQPFRTGSFKIGKGRFREAELDIQRLERNARRYQKVFGN